MITYEITKPIKKIHKLEIKSNVTLPYGVVMELQSLLLVIMVMTSYMVKHLMQKLLQVDCNIYIVEYMVGFKVHLWVMAQLGI